jgi:Pretoxin HINT domain
VTTARGEVAIETVQVGDLVLSRDEQTRQTVFSFVEKTFVRQAAALVVLELEGAEGRLETIKATPEHPFYVAGTGFVPARALSVGTRLVTLGQTPAPLYLQVASRDNDSAGALLVKSLTLEAGERTVYNFKVADTHSYAVGTLKAWVHNADYVTLTAKDLGLNTEVVRDLKITYQVTDGVANARIDMIDGDFGGSFFNMVPSLTQRAGADGASSLKISGIFANDTLEAVAMRYATRMGATIVQDGGTTIFSFPIK